MNIPESNSMKEKLKRSTERLEKIFEMPIAEIHALPRKCQVCGAVFLGCKVFSESCKIDDNYQPQNHFWQKQVESVAASRGKEAAIVFNTRGSK